MGHGCKTDHNGGPISRTLVIIANKPRFTAKFFSHGNIFHTCRQEPLWHYRHRIFVAAPPQKYFMTLSRYVTWLVSGRTTCHENPVLAVFIHLLSSCHLHLVHHVRPSPRLLQPQPGHGRGGPRPVRPSPLRRRPPPAGGDPPGGAWHRSQLDHGAGTGEVRQV